MTILTRPLSIEHRFWSLIAVVLVFAVAVTTLTVWKSTTPYLAAFQNQALESQARHSARNIENKLTNFADLTRLFGSKPELLDVALGNETETASLQTGLDLFDPPDGLMRFELYDVLEDVVFRYSFDNGGTTTGDAEEQIRLIRGLLEADRPGALSLHVWLERDMVHVFLAQPVLQNRLVEGVLTARGQFALAELMPDSALLEDIMIVRDGSQGTGATADRIVVPIEGTGVSLVVLPDRRAVTRAAGRVMNVAAAAVAMVLILPFGILAIVGRSVIVEPHLALQASEAALLTQKKALSELAAIAEKANDAIIVTDREAHILWVNPAFEAMSGYASDDVIGRVPGSFLQGPDTNPETAQTMRDGIAAKRPVKVEILNYSRADKPYWVTVSITPLHDDHGEHYGFMAISNDVTEQRQQRDALETAKREIEHQALHDPLTNLPNRRALDLALERRFSDRRSDCTMVQFDLDHFKHVNDTMGHGAGDFVLCEVARILWEETREDDLAARIGGDEFMILMHAGATIADGDALATRLRERICKPIRYRDRLIHIGGSFGVAGTETRLIAATDLVVATDSVLYLAKANGRNSVRLYTPAVHDSVVAKRDIAKRLQEAVVTGEFVPFYQPQVDATTKRVTGVETLVRWQCPDRGLLMPGVFLPVAQQLSLVPEIDAMVFRKALADVGALNRNGLSVPKVSFNVTAPRLTDPGVSEVIRQSGPLDFEISFEILESVLLEGRSTVFKYHLDRLRDDGVQIEIDDFGSGHASILGLQEAAPDAMKIDQRLVIPLPSSPSCRRVVRAIVDIGKALDIRIIAEGVETAEHADILADLGCDVLQGFHYAKPMDIDALRSYLGHERGVSSVA